MEKSEKEKLPSSYLVTQANELVSARYVLPVAEQRLVLTMISRIQPDDEDFKPYRVGIGELADFLGVARGSAYRECKKVTKSLLGRVLIIKEIGEELQTHWVSSAKYIDGSGMVTLSFDPKLRPYLLKLKRNFTTCKLEMILSFKSQYTMRIYTFLKQNHRLKEREYELKEFREMLGLRDDQHKEYKHLKSNIIIPVQKELSAKADLTFNFKEIKYGRQVGALKFTILCKKQKIAENEGINYQNIPEPTSNIEIPTDVDPFLQLVHPAHQKNKSVIAVLAKNIKKYDSDYVRRNILYCNAKAEKSYSGFLTKALINDWGHDWELQQKEIELKKPTEIWKRLGYKTQKDYDEQMYNKSMESYGLKHIANS
ncbi:MAG: replication initiation protein [Candidatus Latescibacteria bacterium]|nr:replication initiation protein [Candidatus Latescibacterota bacterium]